MKLLLAVLFAFPLFHSSHAPAVFRTRIDTTAGSFVIETHRDWSPKGADRFHELVRKHYYDNSRFFRVVPGRWVQFGIAGDPKVAQAWRHKTIPDDTLKVHNQPGYVAFANTGPGTRSTQVYINFRDNSAQNDSEPAFAPFGKVVEGWDVVEKLYGGYGENSGSGMRAGHQDKIFQGGNAYMDKEFPKLDHLIRAAIIPDNQVLLTPLKDERNNYCLRGYDFLQCPLPMSLLSNKNGATAATGYNPCKHWGKP